MKMLKIKLVYMFAMWEYEEDNRRSISYLIGESVGLSITQPFQSRVRFCDHGAWPDISQYSISHLAIFILHLAFFLSRISHFFNLASRIFISHRAFLCHIYCQNFFSCPTKSHLECPLQASVRVCEINNYAKQRRLVQVMND